MDLYVKPKSKRMVLWIGIFVALSLLVYLPVYFGVVRSAAYVTATNYIENNKMVNQLLGQNLECHLNLFSGYSIRHTFGGGKADFSINVTGSENKANVSIDLEESVDSWQVTRAQIQPEGSSEVLNLLKK